MIARIVIIISLLILSACSGGGLNFSAIPKPKTGTAPTITRAPVTADGSLTRSQIEQNAGTLLNQDAFLQNQERDNVVKIAIMLSNGRLREKTREILELAAEKSVFDLNSTNIELYYYDIGLSQNSIDVAWQQAESDEIDIVVGPVFGDLTEMLAKNALPSGVPIISLTNRIELARYGVWVFSDPPGLQAVRLVDHIESEGHKNIAMLAPANSYGYLAAEGALFRAKQKNIPLSHLIFYDPKEIDISSSVWKITDYQTRRMRLDILKTKTLEEFGEESPEYEAITGRDTLGDIPFDALILATSTAESSITISGVLELAEVAPQDMRIYGMTSWRSLRGLSDERLMRGAHIIAPDKARLEKFDKDYTEQYDISPSYQAQLIYDAVSYIQVIGRENGQLTTDWLLTPRGYMGVSGLFRLRPDGLVEHLYGSWQIGRDGYEQILATPQEFRTTSYEDLELPS